ncbi:MAG: hypothetical protein AAB686_02480 [Patescibacteria group bacterium]
MRRNKGKFIVLEGTDGSGKATQAKLLVRHLRKESVRVAEFDFPRYGKPSAYFVKEYLNGRFGGLKDISPQTASLFFALDRYAAAPEIRKALADGKTIISNRYVASNLGHQGSKMGSASERRRFFKWLAELEYEILGIPRPNLTMVLHVPARIAQKLVDKKGKREYVGGVKRDLHEADIGHLRQAETTYLDMVKMFPRDFKLVECVERGRLLAPGDIHERVWRIIEKVIK